MSVEFFEFINPRYIQSVSDEPKQMLEPIWGYAREPLVSLEEACKPLYRIVSRLEPHVWIAMTNSNNPSDGLTQNESAAIRLYTMEWEPMEGEPFGCLYSHLNRTLQQIDRIKLRPWFLYLKLFLTALAKLPISSRQIIWRGVRRDHSGDYPPGTKATWWSFSSCTTSLNVLESDLYLGNTGTRTLFSIEAINGRTLQNHSHFTAEEEILLLPGTHLEVLSQLNPAPDLHIIHMRQIRPAHELLEPPFKDAQLLPPNLDRLSMEMNSQSNERKDYHPWYQKKRVLIGLGLAAVLVLLAIIVGSILGSRNKGNKSSASARILSGDYPTLPITTVTPLATTTTLPFIFNASAGKTIHWHDQEWDVLNQINLQADSYNWTSTNVWIDSLDCLHLKLTRDNANQWWSAQLVSQNNFSLGTFIIYVEAAIDKFDPNVHFSLSIQSGVNEPDQIAIEISRRGETSSQAHDLWYTISPTTTSTKMPQLGGTYTTHRIERENSSVTLRAQHDHYTNPLTLEFAKFTLPTLLPIVSGPVSIQLSTFKGRAPINGNEVEIILHPFGKS